MLIKRPDVKGFPGYIASVGKVQFPKSVVEAVRRGVKEGKGLTVESHNFKGINECVNSNKGNATSCLTTGQMEFFGNLHETPLEGELHWIDIGKACEFPRRPWFREGVPLFFEPGVWDEDLGKQSSFNLTIM